MPAIFHSQFFWITQKKHPLFSDGGFENERSRGGGAEDMALRAILRVNYVWTKVDSLAQLELCCCEAGGRLLESCKWARGSANWQGYEDFVICVFGCVCILSRCLKLNALLSRANALARESVSPSVFLALRVRMCQCFHRLRVKPRSSEAGWTTGRSFGLFSGWEALPKHNCQWELLTPLSSHSVCVWKTKNSGEDGPENQSTQSSGLSTAYTHCPM